MANRNRTLTPRKTRLWTSGGISILMTTPGVQVGDNSMGIAFTTKTGREFQKSDTLAHTWLKGHWSLNVAGTRTVRPRC